MAIKWLSDIWEFWNLSQILSKTWGRNEQCCFVVFQLDGYMWWNLHNALAVYRSCKAGRRKGKGQCEMPLLFILSRKEGRKSCRLYSGSGFTSSSEPGVFNLASDEGQDGPLSYAGYCWKDWSENKAKKSLSFIWSQTLEILPTQRPLLPMQIW